MSKEKLVDLPTTDYKTVSVNPDTIVSVQETKAPSLFNNGTTVVTTSQGQFEIDRGAETVKNMLGK